MLKKNILIVNIIIYFKFFQIKQFTLKKKFKIKMFAEESYSEKKKKTKTKNRN